MVYGLPHFMNNMDKEKIYKDFQPKVMGYLNSKICDSFVAEDLCADVFVKVYEKIDTYDSSKAALSTWIYTIARNTLYDYFRTNHQTLELDEDFEAGSSVEEEVCNNQMLEKLADCLEQMPERERDIIILRYYNGETLKTIAEKLGVSYGYVKVLHNKALAEIRRFFEWD